ncbi:MAG: hypothetical protein U0930_23430 [Pirellulales bacterium]
MEIVSNQEPADNNEAANSKTRPIVNFQGSGGLSVAVWKHKTDAGFDNYSVRIERNYKDDSGNFKSTQYLRDQDILRAERLLARADEWIEQDKAKTRGTAERPQQAFR